MNRLVFLNMPSLQPAPLSPVGGGREFNIVKWAAPWMELQEMSDREGQRQLTAPTPDLQGC